MAFPGTYNISYYKGDTYEFKIYPKTTSGSVFDLTGYSVKFMFSTVKGPDGISSRITGYSTISSDKTHIVCAILPGNGDAMNADITYAYDVEISKSSSPYSLVYTLLKGEISVEDQVST
jgi:hypothetical protein